MTSKIPIRNLYYILCYAWNRLEEGELVDVSELDSTELADLFATVLLSGTHHLLRRGLDQGYIPEEAELAGVRGRIDLAVTARRMLITHGRAYCRFDELKVDTLPNQILRATVTYLARASGLDPELRKQLSSLRRELGGISDIRLTKATFRRVQLHGNNRFYRFLLDVCELAIESMILDESTGSTKFRDFLRDEKRMGKLFEDFVFNFYTKERGDLKVKRDQIKWIAQSENDPELTFLPLMNTDISIRSASSTLIIDTKFYSETFQAFYDRRRIHSANLYQLFAYLKNLEADESADGMLLYPVVEDSVRLSYSLPNHRIMVSTLDLRQDWKDLRKELLDLLVHFNEDKVQIEAVYERAERQSSRNFTFDSSH